MEPIFLCTEHFRRFVDIDKPIFAMVTGAKPASSASGRPVTTIRSTLRRTNSAASSGRAIGFSLPESVLNDDILSLDPSKLAQFLPECVHEYRATRSRACIQVILRVGFSRLLSVSDHSNSKVHHDDTAMTDS